MSSQIDTSTGAPATTAATLDALALTGQQPGWRVLDTARTQQFTGEIVFQTQPVISVYFDSGQPYYAVSAGDPSLCDRLIEFGVVEPAQIERGVIRVGNVENLGRLFDRDASVDRDAVMVVLEVATDDVVTTIANTVTSSFTSTAYRHHVSGVHRWFVAPSDRRQHAPAQLAPIGEVAQIDASVTRDLPGWADVADDIDDGVQIEWNEPLGDERLQPPAPLHSVDDSMLESILAADPAPAPAVPVTPAVQFAPPAIEPDEPASATDADDPAPAEAPDRSAPSVEPAVDSDPEPAGDDTWAAAPTETPAIDPDPSVSHVDVVDHVVPTDDVVDTAIDTTTDVDATTDAAPGDFQIVWPDGSEQALLGAAAEATATAPAQHPDPVASEAVSIESVASTEPSAPAPAVFDQLAESTFEEAPVADQRLDMPVIVPADEVVAPTPEPDSAPLTFELPTLAVTENNLPEDHQPEEVVDAVRRALEAIESASAAPARLPSVSMGDLPSFEPTTPLQFDVVDPLVVEPRSSTVDDAAASIEASPESAAADVSHAVIEPVVEPVVEPAVSALQAALPQQVVADAPASDGVVAPTPAVETAAPVADAAPSPNMGFAAPTMHDSAEAVYARAAEQAAPAGPASGIASVVFVDEDPDEDDDRSGALKRLIGSLRRK